MSAAASSVIPKKRSKRKNVVQPETLPEPEDEDITLGVRDLIDLLIFFLSPRQILRWFSYLTLFIVIGYGYKVHMWTYMCVLQSTGIPCKDEYASLLTAPFPVDLGIINEWFTGYRQLVSKSFFSLDWAHVLISFNGCVWVLIIYAFIRFVLFMLGWMLSKFSVRYREFKRIVASKRRNLIK